MALLKKGDKRAGEGGAAVKSLRERAAAKVPVRKEGAGRLEDARKYIRSVINEMKKVHWPTRRETITYTSVVLVAVIIVGALIWIFDSLLSRLLQLIIT